MSRPFSYCPVNVSVCEENPDRKKNWRAIFGAPRVILSDNGGEFNNELLRQVCEQFYITINLTEAEAPWTNGSTKWHNDILGKVIVIKKLKLNNNNTYSIDVIVSYAISAKMSYKVVMALAQTSLYLEKALICHQI